MPRISAQRYFLPFEFPLCVCTLYLVHVPVCSVYFSTQLKLISPFPLGDRRQFFSPIFSRADARANAAKAMVERELERQRHMQIFFEEEERRMENQAYRVSERKFVGEIERGNNGGISPGAKMNKGISSSPLSSFIRPKAILRVNKHSRRIG